eukprot:scaffold32793_cov69-Phaeocystis_antarctica.AAC.1
MARAPHAAPGNGPSSPSSMKHLVFSAYTLRVVSGLDSVSVTFTFVTSDMLLTLPPDVANSRTPLSPLRPEYPVQRLDSSI